MSKTQTEIKHNTTGGKNGPLIQFSLPSRSFAPDTLRQSQRLCVFNRIITPIKLLPRNFCCHINTINVLRQFWLTAYETDWTQKDKAGAIFSPRRHICLVPTVFDTLAAQQQASLQSVSQINNVQLHTSRSLTLALPLD